MRIHPGIINVFARRRAAHAVRELDDDFAAVLAFQRHILLEAARHRLAVLTEINQTLLVQCSHRI